MEIARHARILRAGALGLLLALIATGCGGDPTRALTVGHSVDGRPIVASRVGDRDTSTHVLVVGCIHGNEPAGIAIAAQLERLRPPPDVDVWIVPDLNPDGVTADTRQNAHGVDLNRNFPFRWRPLGGVFDSGPRPLSEPESRGAYRLILRVRPTISIWFHQHLNLVDESEGDISIERRYARLVGLRLRRLTRFRAVPSAGRTIAFRAPQRSWSSSRPAVCPRPLRAATRVRSSC